MRVLNESKQICFNGLLAVFFAGAFATQAIASENDFPKLFNTEPLDDAGLMPAEQAARSIQLPSGFQASLFASEPDIQNPIAMTWDSAGRLWIAENYTYAERKQRFQLNLRDRVIVLDGTTKGRLSKRTVFTDQVQMLTGIEVGLDGVWLMCPPQLLFIPDRNHDDIPDSEAQVVLDGFEVANQNYHNFANGLRFGPDGWLYGRCGGSCPGRIGLPGSPDHERMALEGGIWRYHPSQKSFEVLTSGTTNPWGHDWNDVGEAFFVNTVNGHLWHLIPGAHFTRPFTLDPNRKTFELIDFHADHWHFDTGKNWTDSRDGAANEFGGGHAHIGTMIYHGDNWPAPYQGKLFTLNMHGRRANQERLERLGSGYVAKHEEDFFLTGDPWFRGMELSTGPDGSVFVIDWSDAGECHEHTGVHRTSGRVFKIQYRETEVQKTFRDLRSWSQQALAKAHEHRNLWFTQQARLELQRRKLLNQDLSQAIQELTSIHEKASITNDRLLVQTYLTLHQIGGFQLADHLKTVSHSNPHMRTWAIRLLTETWPIDDALGPTFIAESLVTTDAADADIRDEIVKKLIEVAYNEKSPLVRLALASTLQRIPVHKRHSLAIPLVSYSVDSSDHNLPKMIWYGLIPVSDELPDELLEVAKHCQLNVTLRLIARSIAEQIETMPETANALLRIAMQDKSKTRSILLGFDEGLRGWQQATMPKCWPELQKLKAKDSESLVTELSVLFGDGRAMKDLKALALDRDSDNVPIRIQALETLIQNQSPELKTLCLELLNDSRINFVAAQGLAMFSDKEVGEELIKNYNRFRGPKRPQVISILASRPEFASQLIQAIQEGKIPKADLNAYQVRQIKGFADTSLLDHLSQVWGEIRDTSQDKQERIDQFKTHLSATTGGDLSQGRVLFQKLCSQCHRLYGDGQMIGPDLTGGNRSNLDYLLHNVIDPSAVVDKDYRMQIVLLEDGRTLNGLIIQQNDRTVTLQTATERLELDRQIIESIKKTDLSPMPDGLLDSLKDEQIVNLFAYLRHPTQVALPNTLFDNSNAE